MFYYYLMAIYLIAALAAIKIDGWISALLLIISMLACSPVFKPPSKAIKWSLVVILTIIAIWLFPDIEQYRENFEQSLDTAPIKPQD